MVMNVMGWVLCGLIIGAVARALVPGKQQIGLMMTAILGIVGAFVGGLIASLLWGVPPADVATIDHLWPGWLFSILGATLVLWAFVALSDRREEPMVPSIR